MDSQVRAALEEASLKEDAKQAQETIAHLRAKLTVLQKDLNQYQKEAGAMAALERTIVDAVKAAEPYPRVKLIARGHESDYPMAMVADLSDLHVGQVTRPEETEGWGHYNWAIAQQRMGKYAENIVGNVNTYRKSFIVDDLYVIGKGDYISGNIHEELMMTNEFPPPVQAVNAGTAIGDFLLRVAPHFKNVRFIGVGADNHGRLGRKPQAKLKSTASYSFVTHAIAQKHSSRADNLEFILAPGMKWVQEIAGKRFLIEHGDTIKSQLGIPYYGMQRSVGREARRRMNDIKKNFHYYSIGHFHTPGIVDDLILINGALSGTDEFDHSCGRLASPCQVSYLVHPKYGIFGWTAWRFKVENGEENSHVSSIQGPRVNPGRAIAKARKLIHA